MKVLVTVGTTPFPSLIEKVCKISDLMADEVTFIFQTATECKYTNERSSFFSYINDITSVYGEVDLVITHAGAGSIYTLLDMGVKILVVPNLERNDKHQVEMADFVSSNNYGAVAYTIEALNVQLILDVLKSEFEIFKKEPFFIRDYVFGK